MPSEPVEITLNNRVIRSLPAERFMAPYPDTVRRADPLLCRAPDGSVYLAAQGWLKGDDPEGFAAAPGIPWLLRSTDRGQTWQSLKLELRPVGWNVQAFGILRDGTMLLTFEAPVPPGQSPWHDQWRRRIDPAHTEFLRCINGYFVTRSTDGGRTWSEGCRIDSRPYHSWASFTRILELPNGTLLLTANGRYGTHTIDITTGQPLPPEQTGLFEHVLVSVDGGKTWPRRHLLANHAAETQLLRLPSGKLLAATRGQSPPGDGPALAGATIGATWHGSAGRWTPPPGVSEDARETGHKRMWLAESDDEGRTWHSLRQAVFDGQESPGELHRLQDGRLLLITCDRGDPGGIRAHVSGDDGLTWEPQIIVLRRYAPPRAPDYPSSVIFDDGTILTMTGLNEHNPAVAVRWRMPAELAGGAQPQRRKE